MLLTSILWYILIGSERVKGREINKEMSSILWVKRVLFISLFFSIILSINNLYFLGFIDTDLGLFNNYFQWTITGCIFEVFTYVMILVLIRSNWDLDKFLSIFGVILLLYVNDYISFYIALESQSLILYILASRDSISSGIKYFVYGSLSSAIIILGIAIIFNETGMTDIMLINNITDNNNLLFGRKLIILGLFIKLGVAPFHLWNIDVMDNSNIDLTAWFGIISKISLFYVFRLLLPTETGLLDISVFILISLFIGTFMGLIQNKIKRLFAYSGLIHTGFILLGIQALLLFSHTEGSLTIYIYWLFYILQYFLSFLVILLIIQNLDVRYIQDISLNPFTMTLFVLHLLSLSGFPPLSGFIGKFFILKSLITQAFLLCLLAILSSVFSFFIYFNVISLIKLDPLHTLSNSTDSWIISLSSFFLFSSLFSFFLL